MTVEDGDLTPRNESVYEIQPNASQRESVFDPTQSPLYQRMGFVVGVPRSGTTWLQQLLLVHPLVTTGGESHLFCEGLNAVFDNFAYPDATSHLSTWVNRAELVTAARAFCDAVFEAQRAGTRPGAKVIVEKTPNHRLQAELQATIYPDARYVHIVRDARDSAASQRQLWGKVASEYSNPTRVAEQWAESVRDMRRHFGPLGYLELRYEDIRSDTPGALATIFEHLGLPHNRALCEAAAEFGKAPVNTAPKMVGVGVREQDGDVLAERAAARAAGDLLIELGYADAAEVARLKRLRNASTVALDARDAATHAFDRIKANVDTTRDRLEKRAKRKARQPVELVSTTFADSITGSDAAKLSTVFSPAIKLDGDTRSDAKEAATELIERFGDSRIATRRVSDNFIQIVAITKKDQRVVFRIQVENGVAVAVDTRT